jgi:hypothetical protein
VFTLKDGRVVTGRIINIHGDTWHVNTDMLNPSGQVNVNRKQVESMKTSTVSMMPAGLLDTLHEDEVLDLVAFLLSRGDRSHPMFRRRVGPQEGAGGSGRLSIGGKDDDAAQAKADESAVREYLAKNHAGKKWQVGPKRLDSDEIRRAYGKRRFYYVFSAPPIPPGAFNKDLIMAYQKRVEEHRTQYIGSLTVGIDEQNNLLALHKPADFNAGLMPVKTDEDAQLAAAAVLSLFGSTAGVGGASPGVVAAKDVQVTRTKDGWSCSAAKKFAFQGSVTFDAKGQVMAVSKVSTLPPPP